MHNTLSQNKANVQSIFWSCKETTWLTIGLNTWFYHVSHCYISLTKHKNANDTRIFCRVFARDAEGT